jgi:hypothetical protein
MLAIAHYGHGYGFGVAPETCDPNTEFFDRDTQTCQKFDAVATAPAATAPGAAPVVTTPATPVKTPTPIVPPAAAAAAVPFFKKPMFWVIVGGVAVVGGGAFAIKRMRRPRAAY